jgi:hypothetical protein
MGMGELATLALPVCSRLARSNVLIIDGSAGAKTLMG